MARVPTTGESRPRRLGGYDDAGAFADGVVAIDALREGTDPEVVGEVSSVEIDLGDESWLAEEADDPHEIPDLLEPGMSQADSVEIDERTVRGTATSVRQQSVSVGDGPETMTGSFKRHVAGTKLLRVRSTERGDSK